MAALTFDAPFDQHLTTSEAVFLHALWRFARRDRELPEEADLPCARLEYLRADLMILRPVEPDDWVCELCGEHIAARATSPLVGQRISQTGEWPPLDREVFRRARDEKRPIVMLSRQAETQEKLVLPVGRNGAVSGLYILTKVRGNAGHAPQSGAFILQFQRDRQGRITGAALAATDLPEEKTSEAQLSLALMVKVPSLRDPAFWDRCVTVAENRRPTEWTIPPQGEAEPRGFRIRLSPYLDGVAVTFAEMREAQPGGLTSSLSPAA